MNIDLAREDFEKWIAQVNGVSREQLRLKRLENGHYKDPLVDFSFTAFWAASSARHAAKECLSLCEKEVIKGIGDEKDGAMACCAAIATEFGLEGK